MKYRLFMPKADSYTSIQCESEESARIERQKLWDSGYLGPIAVQFFNDRFPQDGWRDVPYYQEYYLA
jgi:hypothetical protein